MANTSRRTHTAGSVVATVVLIACAALLGAWAASGYDALRVGVLDTALANRLGYIGEITDATTDPRPHGIPRAALTAMFSVGLVGGAVGYAATAVARRFVDDPAAVAYAFGSGSIGAALGFAWLASGWPEVEASPAGAFGAVVGAGGVWVPALLLAIGALCAFAWWTADEERTSREAEDTDEQAPPPTSA